MCFKLGQRPLVVHFFVLILFLPLVVPHTQSIDQVGSHMQVARRGAGVSGTPAPYLPRANRTLLLSLSMYTCVSRSCQLPLSMYTCVLVYKYILVYWNFATAILSILVLERLPLWAPADVNTLSTVAHSTANLYNCLESSTEINLAEMQMIVALFIDYYAKCWKSIVSRDCLG